MAETSQVGVCENTGGSSYSWAYLVAAIASFIIIIISIYNIWIFNKIRNSSGVLPTLTTTNTTPITVSDGTTGVIVNVILLILGIFILIAALYFLFAGGSKTYVVQRAVPVGPAVPVEGSSVRQSYEAQNIQARPPSTTVVYQQPPPQLGYAPPIGYPQPYPVQTGIPVMPLSQQPLGLQQGPPAYIPQTY